MNLKIFAPAFFVIFLAQIYILSAHAQTQEDSSQIKPASSIQNSEQNISEQNKAEFQVESKEKTILTPEAQETYAYLLFIQSLLEEDEASLLEVMPELSKSKVPLSVWLDGGVWLMGRKSPNSVTFLEHAVKSYPADLSLNLLYSEALGDHGMPGKGVEVMRNYIKEHPDSLDAHLELALLLVKDKQFDEAQKTLSEINPRQRSWLVDYYQAKALIGMNKNSLAIPYLRKVIKAMPDFAEAILELAIVYKEEDNFREARAAFEKLQKLNYSPLEVSLQLISLSLKLKQPERAIRYFRQGPDSLQFRLQAANMFLEAHHYLQAESILKEIASREDSPCDVYLLLADITYEQKRNLEQSLDWLKKMPPQSQCEQRNRLLRIQLMAEAGKTSDAVAEATAAIKDFPDLGELREMKIRLLARDKKTDEALELAQEAVTKWPDSIPMAFLLGSLLDEKGRKKEALDIMENIIKKQPDNFQALNYVGYTLAEENRDLERALELLRKADSLSPNQAYIVDSLAWALHKSGKTDEAYQQIKKAINLGDGQDAAIWEHYGDIAAKKGKRDEARKAYRKAIYLKPDNANEIRKRLSDL